MQEQIRQAIIDLVLLSQTMNCSERTRILKTVTAIQVSVVHTLSGYYILIIARFVRGCAVFERVLARRALGAIL